MKGLDQAASSRRNAEIFALFKSGRTRAELARQFNLRRETIGVILCDARWRRESAMLDSIAREITTAQSLWHLSRGNQTSESQPTP